MKLRRCPNLHYYDGDKYAQCPHCAATQQAAPVQPAPAKQSETQRPVEQVKQPEAPKQPEIPKQPEAPSQHETLISPEAPKALEAVKEAAPGFTPASETTWRCECGAVNQGRFCQYCGKSRPAASSPETTGQGAFQQVVLKPENAETDLVIHKETEAEKERSLTAQLDEVSFTGNMEDARIKASKESDEGATQVIFDDIDDGFVLAWLTVTNGSAKGKVYTMTDPKNTIGRSDMEHPVDIDIRNDRGISRGVQAVIVYDPLNKKFFLQTGGGKTYVYVNKEMLLTYRELAPYDIIRIGETNLVFVPLCSEKFSW